MKSLWEGGDAVLRLDANHAGKPPVGVTNKLMRGRKLLTLLRARGGHEGS